ncbi:RICIN domain-containing protein [Actinoplanes sp. NPDC049681]|uniref:RICIN domain-containing protein n=1 Tax=Actinoplanes sp. NPDC049681 TaxID=3363905 RepID=UPI0037909670
MLKGPRQIRRMSLMSVAALTPGMIVAAVSPTAASASSATVSFAAADAILGAGPARAASSDAALAALSAIRNGYGNRLCLDAKNDAGGNPNNNGDTIQLWSCNGGSQQGWGLSLAAVDGNGTYWWTIQNQYGNHLCLDAKNDSGGNPNNNGDKVQLWTCSGASQQQWDVGGTTIRNRYGNHLCLDAKNDSGGNPNNNGDKVQLWTCSGASQQDWY